MSETGPSFTEDDERRWITEQQAQAPAEREREQQITREAREMEGEFAEPGISAPVAAGGGAIAGATGGMIFGGPIGAIVGAITGAAVGGVVGGAGGSASEFAAHEHAYDEEADRAYRAHYESAAERLADRSFESVRPAYLLGHVVARDPRFFDRSFDVVEPELRRAWSEEAIQRYGAWEAIRPFTMRAYEESRARARGETFADPNLSGGVTHQRASFSDPIPKYVDPAPTSTGQDAAGSRQSPVEDDYSGDRDAGRVDKRG